MAFSGAIELIQLGIPGRHARVSDFVVDALSVSIGVGIAFMLAEYEPFAGLRR
jgi:VanZ family protein